VKPITSDQHLDFLASRPHASFLQTPAWGKVKSDWRCETIGWFEADKLVGAGLVLYRKLPKLDRYLAYLPEGPVVDWDTIAISDYLHPLVAYLRDQKAFAIRLGPTAVWHTWDTATVKQAIADPQITKLSDAAPDSTSMPATRLVDWFTSHGWISQKTDHGFAAGQPPFNFWLPLTGKTPDDLLKGMNQLWRRNIKKATKMGVTVRTGEREDLAVFHQVYSETAARDGFTPRPLSYFETMWDVLRAEDPDRIRLYLAEHESDVVAATTWVRLGNHVWYSYGASTNAKREVRGSNAIQWAMIQDALAVGADVYDMRGITEGLEADDPELGLIQFKVGTGGKVVEYVGEWDLALNPVLYRGFQAYMNRDAIIDIIRRGMVRATSQAKPAVRKAQSGLTLAASRLRDRVAKQPVEDGQVKS
jgi:lipid II:glycine glycyltransferase (peptidoglycan interpeptide bridge formation enzyme)